MSSSFFDPVDSSLPGSSVHSPGKNTGTGCYALLQGIFPTLGLIPGLLISPALADGFFIVSATWEALFPRCVVLCLVAQSCLTLCDPTECNPPGSSVLGDSPGKNTGVGCHALLQGIFPTQGLNPGPLHCRQILYHMSHQGSLRILEWVDYHFSRGSS